MCAAALLMDLDFDARSAADVWFLDMMPDDAQQDRHFAYRDEQTPSFWSSIFDGLEADLLDPHGVVYTTPYQSTASGWYGGNMTLIFAPADLPWGSGIDKVWMERGCAGPPQARSSRRPERRVRRK